MISPRAVSRVNRSSLSIWVTGSRERQAAAFAQGLGRERQGGRERAEDPLPGDLQRAERTRSERWLAPVELVAIHLARLPVAVLARGRGDPRKGVELLGRPRDQKGARGREWDPRLGRVVAQELIAAGEELGFDRPGLRVEARVMDRGVRLAGPGADIGGGLDEDAARPASGELARDRRAHHPGADDGDVKRAGWERSAAQAHGFAHATVRGCPGP